jgi:CYTH domain-containing protein/8-oxo-dGTP pyrophosphatase MutT (NUDIX family)
VSDEVRAAGGLVERGGRVLVVHRPRYDDWSLPKGKLEPGETFEAAAQREVHEETGLRVTLGEELPPTRYADARGRPKVVRYWRMAVLEEEPFAPNEEVDELAWLTPARACERLTYDHDRVLVARSDEHGEPGAEIERKFLVSRLPDDLDDHPRRTIAQGYLVLGDPEVRIRRIDDAHVLTIKAGDGLARAEEELAIDADRFARLWPLTQGRRVEKVRHVIAHGGRTIELDVFAGANEGLAVAEVEFPSVDAARAWSGPDWLGREVTGDPAYRNATLAR